MFHKEDPWKMATLLLAGLFIGIVVTQGYHLVESRVSDGDTKMIVDQRDQDQTVKPVVEQIVDVDIDDDPILGDSDAPVTIVEFSDFQCPYCQRFYQNTMPQLISEYVDTGKVKIVYRDFPLGAHPQAPAAAQASECADDQDSYWDMHDMLFAKMSEWSGSPTAIDSFKAYASDLGLNTAKFNDCLDTEQYATEITDDLNAGRQAGVSGTPTFFINGRKLVGAQPFSAFQTIIEEELAK